MFFSRKNAKQQLVSPAWLHGQQKRGFPDHLGLLSLINYALSVFFVLCSVGMTYRLYTIEKNCHTSDYHGSDSGSNKSRFNPFIPPEATAPDHSNPLNYGYYQPPLFTLDIFDNTTILDRRMADLGIHSATTVLVNGDYKTWTNTSTNTRHKLYPKLTDDGEEEYVISSLHTRHCLLETILDYGYLLNGILPRWPDAHTIHCFERLYKEITCRADSTVEGFAEEQIYDPDKDRNALIEIQRVTETRDEPLCRNFQGLLDWAGQPDRSIPFYYTGTLKKDKVRVTDGGSCDLRVCRGGSKGWKHLG